MFESHFFVKSIVLKNKYQNTCYNKQKFIIFVFLKILIIRYLTRKSMTTKDKFEKLKELDINTKSKVQRAKINLELERLADIDVNGKPAKFTQEEISTLNFAFNDISKKIGSVHISC